jgi:hypothetical protein
MSQEKRKFSVEDTAPVSNWKCFGAQVNISCCNLFLGGGDRVSTEVTFWHSAEYGSDFRCNSGEIPRNSAEFRGISPELHRNHLRSQKIPRNSVSAEFCGHPRGGWVLGSAFSLVASMGLKDSGHRNMKQFC